MALFCLYGICLLVGVLVGGTGMGGILIPPALMLLGGLAPHTAMATTLASFAPMNLLGCVLYTRMGHMDRRLALPLVAGGALSAGPAALFNTHLRADFLTALLALLVLFAGCNALRRPKTGAPSRRAAFWLHRPGVFVVGAVTGLAAGITGAGGPLLAIAWLITAGLPPLTAVALSMPYSVATALTGTASNWLNGNIDWPALWRVASLELFGFVIGAAIVRRMPVLWVRRCIAVTCIVLGCFLLLRSLLSL